MLMKCPECELPVSDKALSCPHCGYVLNNELVKKRVKKSNKRKRLPNGFGQISEIKNKKLRKPFRAMITIGKTETGRHIVKPLQPESYFESYNDAYMALVKYHENPYSISESTTLIELYKKWSEEYFRDLDDSSIRTVTSAWAYVTPGFQKMEVSSLQPQMIKDEILVRASRPDPKNPSIIRKPSNNIKSRMKSMFNLMFDYAILAGLVQINIARQFSLKGIEEAVEKDRKDKTPITREHEAELWNDIEFGYTKMLLINIYSGWRPDELLKLRKEDIDLKKGFMRGGEKTDAGVNRLVPIHPKIKKLVKYYYDRSKGDLLFYDYDTKKPSTMTYDKYRRRFEKIADRHGWTEYTSSCPRHAFATRAKENKMDDYAKKLMMGHKIKDVDLKHYTHLNLEKFLSEEIRKI